ncbi:MAG TPA: hypothetical protein VLM37_03080 [Fibrobacteraceae bacterium]|nr:hypothetical protein [Fibrobacteraceae bacterium]
MRRLPYLPVWVLLFLLSLAGLITLGWFWHQGAEERRLAGGSATGNALDVVQASQPESVDSVSDGDSLMASTVPVGEHVAAWVPPQKHEERDSVSLWLETWLRQQGVAYRRVIQLSPEGDNVRGRVGLAGPAFRDLTLVPGGLSSGDLILYRAGSYRYSAQFPSRNFKASADWPLTLLAWPGETVRVELLEPLSPDSSAHWQIFGLDSATLVDPRSDTLAPRANALKQSLLLSN